jgi:DNA-binding transcriptional regulator YhcF (GntR family)
MNTTQELVLNSITTDKGFATVAELVEATGKSETTVRKALKELATEGKVVKNGNEWSLIAETSKKKYKPANPTTPRTDRKNRYTKAELVVAPADEFDRLAKKHSSAGKFDGYDGEKWVTMCLTHGTAQGHDLILDAYFRSSWPTFCPECNSKLTPEQRRKVRKVKSSKKAA